MNETEPIRPVTPLRVRSRAVLRADQRTPRSARAGFSLLELVISLTIIGALAGVASLRYASSLALQRLDAVTSRIVSDIELARSRALSTSGEAQVSFRKVGGFYRILVNGQPLVTGGQADVILARDPYHAAIAAADFGGDHKIIFDAYGTPDSGGSITIRVADLERTVVVDASTGRAGIAE